MLIATVLGLATLPLVLLLAVASAISFRAWPFFVQRRMGRGGRSFRFVKIRSLPTTAPKYADKYALADVRNSRFGTLLRATHLDELPQLWLVLAGRMSLVGPRPEMAAVAETFDPVFVAARTEVRPGCTGPWQVSEAADRLIGEDERFDRYYLEAASFGLDLVVLWRTVAQLFGAAPLTYERLRAAGDGHLLQLVRGADPVTLELVLAFNAPEVTVDRHLFRHQLLALFDDAEPLATAMD